MIGLGAPISTLAEVLAVHGLCMFPAVYICTTVA